MNEAECSVANSKSCVKRRKVRQDLTGKRFGRLLVLDQSDFHTKPSGQQVTMWECRCDCGNAKLASGCSLLDGKVKSCGCFRIEFSAAKQRTHGMSKTRVYAIWAGIIDRCENPNAPIWGHYGGRGITVCERWRESFENFLADMGPRPSPKHSIERQNNDGNYEPGNCIWATKTIQMRNTRTNVFIECQGQRRCASEWAEIVGMKSATLLYRISQGWSPETAIFRPTRRFRRKVSPPASREA